MYWVQASLLNGIVSLLTVYFGVDLNEFGKRIGFDFRQFENPQAKLPLDDVGQMLEDCAAHTNCPHFGALLASHQANDVLSIMGLFAMFGEHSDSLEDALHKLFDNTSLIHIGINWQLTTENEFAYILLSIDSKKGSFARQGIMLAMAQGYNLIKTISNNQWSPGRVCLTANAPASSGIWKRFFGDNIAFNQDFNGFIFERKQLKLPTTNQNKKVMTVLNEYLKLSGNTPHIDRMTKMKMVIRKSLLLNQQCRLKDIAENQNQSSRTIQYYLKNRGSSFQQLLNEVRYEVACDLLSESEQSISTISALVGFADTSVFSRSFKKHKGLSPLAYRNKTA